MRKQRIHSSIDVFEFDRERSRTQETSKREIALGIKQANRVNLITMR